MSGQDGTFEKLEHEAFSGELIDVPLRINEQGVLDEDSNALLFAASLIAGNVQIESIENLRDKVGAIISEPEAKKGLIIEDSESGGAISLDSEVTKVRIRNGGQWAVKTELLFDMLYQWAEYSQKPDS